MSEPTTTYRRAFWTSRYHVWLGIVTLGLGFATGEPLGLLAGAVLYALGWVFVPDLAFYRRAIDKTTAASRREALTAEVAVFQQQQERALQNLSAARRRKYDDLAKVCRDLAVSATESHDSSGLDLETRRQKLDELRWAFLRMLAVEQSLEVYLETERKEQLPEAARSLEAEIATLTAEISQLEGQRPTPPVLDGKKRLQTSLLERLAVLNQRLSRIEQANTNYALLRSEQERLVEQVKLIRADAIASRNTDTLTARIDLSISHLASTNQWLSELAEFKDLTAQTPWLPSTPSSATPARSGATRQREHERPAQ